MQSFCMVVASSLRVTTEDGFHPLPLPGLPNQQAEKKKMKSYEKDIKKKDFIERYGKEKGESVYYATITKMAKKNSATLLAFLKRI